MKTLHRCLPALSAALLPALLTSCSPRPSDVFQGYLEGEFVYVASPMAGLLTNLAVKRGSEVKTGQLLFQLEGEPESATLREAAQRLAQAKSQLENLTKGRRPTEIASLEAQRDRARANLRLSELELERRDKLIQSKVISPSEMDSAKAQRDADQAQVSSLEAELATARLGARDDEVKAAQAEVQALESAMAKAQWALTQKSQFSPTNAWVDDTLYRPGEFVVAGNPVVSLLPPENIKARFFVPQAQLTSVPMGQVVSVNFDGAPAPLTATVNYVAMQAEFTPPVIYSQENRAKLVFMVEAAFAPADARHLRPGQPVNVRLNP